MPSLQQSTDTTHRLHRRLVSFYLFVVFVVLLLGVVYAITCSDAVLLVTCVILFSISSFLCTYETDVATLFLAIHPTITYAGTTLLFAIFSGNFFLNGLLDKDTAFAIVAVYQVSLFVAYLISRLLLRRTIALPSNPPIVIDSFRASLVAMAGFFVFALAASFQHSSILAAAPVALALFCLGLGFYLNAERARSRVRSAFLISIFAVSACALLLNQRTSLFLLLLFWTVYFFGTVPKLFTVRNFAFLVIAFCVLNWVTFSFITARNENREDTSVNTLTRTLDLALSDRGLFAIIPFIPHDEPVRSFSSRQNRYYSEFLGGGQGIQDDDTSVFGRLAQIGAMDIVTGRLGPIDDIDFSKWGALAISALPNIGQDKYLLLSDELVWNAGLRDRSVVGAPLVTVAGEMYSMGGYFGMFLLSTVVFALIFSWLIMIRRVIGYNSIYVGVIFSVIYDITCTGTALGSIIAAVRTLPLLLALGLVSLRFVQRRSDRGLRKGDSLSAASTA